MTDYRLRLTVDELPAGAVLGPLPALNRVVYVREGSAAVEAGPRLIEHGADSAWQGAEACSILAGAAGAVILRYELLTPGAQSSLGKLLLEHAIDLNPDAEYLMRCDRVDFEPGGVALPHGHRGGGIRCLIAGSLEVTVGDHPPKLMRPGDAWFESGREPVLAASSSEEPTSFIRSAILPREIRGQSSIWYVDPADAQRSRPRKYTVYVDEPIEVR